MFVQEEEKMIEVICNPGDDYLPSEPFKMSLPALESRHYRRIYIIGLHAYRGDNVIYVNNYLLKDLIQKNTVNSILMPMDSYGLSRWLNVTDLVLGLPWAFRKDYIAGRKEALKNALRCLFRI